jgi:hypothetical protein
LEDTPSGLAALLQSTGDGVSTLFAAWSADGSGWTVSSPLALASHQQLLSFGPTSGSGLFALTRAPSGAERLLVIGAADTAWRHLPDPPQGTATVAFGSGTSQALDAFAVHESTATVWTLADPAAPGPWVHGQVIHVALTFGSSS